MRKLSNEQNSRIHTDLPVGPFDLRTWRPEVIVNAMRSILESNPRNLEAIGV